MDFFARQERSRRTTRALIGLFLLAVAATVAAVSFATAILIGLYQNPAAGTAPLVLAPSEWLFAQRRVLGAIAIVTAAFIGLASSYRIATLGRGGGQVARLLGGTAVPAQPADLLQQRLVNVVEEISIASGTPVPEIYVLEQEQGINAFAAGLTPTDAAIAVTRGALERLSRSELQGVVAHEFSHILNGDMRLNQRLIGWLFGILVVALLGRWLLRSVRIRSGRRGGSAGAMLLAMGATLVLVGSIGLFFSRLIKAAVSRRREELADASAVQFTRDRLGLAGALKKIGGYTGELAARNGEEVAHMLFSRGARAFRGWFATHPPIDRRIVALDPSFVPGAYPDVTQVLPAEEASGREPMHRSFAAQSSAAAADDVLARVGDIATHETAAALRRSIPESIDHAAHSRELSLLLVLAFGLSRDRGVRDRQLDFLRQQLGPVRATKCRDLASELDGLDDRQRLPVVELSVPALKQRPGEQVGFVVDLLQRLTALNPELGLFDYVLLRVLETYVAAGAAEERRRPLPRPLSSRAAVAALLECVAAYGHADPHAALGAYRAGLEQVFPDAGERARRSFDAVPGPQRLASLDAALARLAGLRPRAKQRVLSAVAVCIRHDRRIAVAEYELFRAIAATLGCPAAPSPA